VIPISRSKTFQFSSPRRGDIIAFEKPAPDALACDAPTLLKRCAALPGDTLFFSENSIRLPGFTIEIPALEHAPPSGSIVLPRAGETIALSAGSARFFQALIEEEGHTVMVDQDGLVRLDDFPASEYTVSQDAYFVLGDNRSSSLDSRFFGAVPAGRIVGKAFLIYWSRSDARERDAFGNPFEGVRWTRIGTLLH
jgi:signal peptidase I